MEIEINVSHQSVDGSIVFSNWLLWLTLYLDQVLTSNVLFGPESA